MGTSDRSLNRRIPPIAVNQPFRNDVAKIPKSQRICDRTRGRIKLGKRSGAVKVEWIFYFILYTHETSFK